MAKKKAAKKTSKKSATKKVADIRIISVNAFRKLEKAFKNSPQEEGRFSGTKEEKDVLATAMHNLFSTRILPGESTFKIDYTETIGLANDLYKARNNFSIGQYLNALASLLER